MPCSCCGGGTGACCTCASSNNLFGWTDDWYFPTDLAFCTEAEAAAFSSLFAEQSVLAAAEAAEALRQNGYICVTESSSGTPAGVYEHPPSYPGELEDYGCEGETLWHWYGGITSATGYCCGTVDASAAPIWDSSGFLAALNCNNCQPVAIYPCVGPYTYSTCTDGVAAADCCGVHRPNQTCDEGACIPDGACCIEGECSIAKEADCLAAGGVWQGEGTTCEDGDCASGCCVSSTNEDGCAITVCEPGHFFCGTPCFDAEAPQQPSSGYKFCLPGTGPPQTTVTGSGVTFNTGDAALDQLLSDAMNASYALGEFDCSGTSQTEDFALGAVAGITYTARVSLTAGCGAAGRYASISVISSVTINGFSSAAVMERNEGARTSQTTSCGDSICDCSEGVSGAPTSSAGWANGNYTSADITTS